jgi:hypothetical protein
MAYKARTLSQRIAHEAGLYIRNLVINRVALDVQVVSETLDLFRRPAGGAAAALSSWNEATIRRRLRCERWSARGVVQLFEHFPPRSHPTEAQSVQSLLIDKTPQQQVTGPYSAIFKTGAFNRSTTHPANAGVRYFKGRALCKQPPPTLRNKSLWRRLIEAIFGKFGRFGSRRLRDSTEPTR